MSFCCRTKEHVGQLYGHLVMGVKDGVFYQGQRGIRNRMLEQFSSSYSGVDEARIVDRVTNNDPKLRLIITTIALGMGIDMAGVERVYHWGCPDNILRYWQEVGRAGRDGRPAKAKLFATPLSVVKTQDSMKKLIETAKAGSCVRKAILEALTLTTNKTCEKPVLCCCNCTQTAK